VGEGYPQIWLQQTNRKDERKNMGMDNVPRCQHVKMNGTQCGSPALRRRRLCFFHERIRRERAKIAADTTAQRGFDLPLLEDANSVQVALMKVIQMLGSGRMDHRTAGLMLYALQTASTNLRRAEFEAIDATDVVIDRDDVYRTSIGGPQWFAEDFDDEPDAEDENEEQAEVEEQSEVEEQAEIGDQQNDKPAIAARQVAAAAAPKEPAQAKHLSLEETRMRVQGAVRNWLLENAGGNAAGKPG
jgi:hypothetical protein